jgi:SAM-dependent methyltransferase
MENKTHLTTIFWFLGPTCAGKSFLSEKLSDKLNIQNYHLDCYVHCMDNDQKSLNIAYKNLINDHKDIFILDGYIPFINEEHKIALFSALPEDVRIIYVLVKPNYINYCENILERKKISNNFNIIPEEDYLKSFDIFTSNISKYILIHDESDMYQKITEEDIRSLRYQHFGHTEKKWNKLQIDCNNKTILDLGCSSCFYEIFSKQQGAKKYTGLDVNMAYLFNSNAHLFDLNHLEEWKERYDIVISTSMIHYIKDKENFIKNAARLTNELFILELPLSKLSELVIECDPNRHYLYFPSKSLIEYWILKYFKSFECLGHSIVEDNSYRLIYHCKK